MTKTASQTATGRQVPPLGLLPSNLDSWDITTLEQLPKTYVDLSVTDGFRVRLRRFRKPNAKAVVVLVHGASASSRTFMVPNGGLLRFLVEAGYDVWTLDWRSSKVFCDFNPLSVRHAACSREGLPPERYWTLFDLDRAAAFDLREGLSAIGEWLRDQEPENKPVIRLVAHCVGGAITSQALSAGLLTSDDLSFNLGPVVISTLGLFYRVGLEGWLKGNEFLLEGLTTTLNNFAEPEHPVISPILPPGARWPRVLEDAFEVWRKTPFAPNGWGPSTAPESIERMAFMYGMPFHAGRLSSELSTDALALQFGDMPLGVYLHCVRNLRMGFATRFDAPTDECYVTHRHIIRDGAPVVPVTLLTGDENQVWHRDSIDRMYEWLVNHTEPRARRALRKHVLTGYAHQDLLWSDTSATDVYPLIATGLLA